LAAGVLQPADDCKVPPLRANPQCHVGVAVVRLGTAGGFFAGVPFCLVGLDETEQNLTCYAVGDLLPGEEPF